MDGAWERIRGEPAKLGGEKRGGQFRAKIQNINFQNPESKKMV